MVFAVQHFFFFASLDTRCVVAFWHSPDGCHVCTLAYSAIQRSVIKQRMSQIRLDVTLTLASSSTELTKNTRCLTNTTLRTTYEVKFLVDGKKRDSEHGAKSRGGGELSPRDDPHAITPFTPTDSVSVRQTGLPV